MGSLHDAGWRQGCLITAELSTRIYSNLNGGSAYQDIKHGLWLLAEQDCDLAQTPDDDMEKLFELRAVRKHDGDVPSSIVGSKVRIDNDRCIVAMDLIVKVTAAWLTQNVFSRTDLDGNRRRQIKTWLGYRYDRPAVPQQFKDAHARIKALAHAKRSIPDPSDPNKSDAKLRKIDMSNVRDVMVAYEQPSQNGKVRANVTAIANNATNIAEILNWIERIRDAVEDAEPLIILDVAANDTRNTPISLLEEAFSIYGDKHSLSLTRFPGHTHSAGEEPAYEVSWEKNVEHSARNSSRKRFTA